MFQKLFLPVQKYDLELKHAQAELQNLILESVLVSFYYLAQYVILEITFKNTFCFLKGFISAQGQQRGRPSIPFLYVCTPLAVGIPGQSGPFVTHDESMWKHHFSPKGHSSLQDPWDQKNVQCSRRFRQVSEHLL